MTNQIKINEVKFKTESLKDYAILLLQNGFRVFVYDSDCKEYEKTKWLIIEKNKNVGYIQLNDFDGFQFSTQHKPNRTTGTGYGLNHDLSWSPTIENALKTFIKYPEWAKKKDISSIIKWSSIEEYLNSDLVLKYIEVKL
jgi:hypothetical protein